MWLHHARAATVLLFSAACVLIIPSIPPHRWHPVYWAGAFLIEVALVVALWPFYPD